MVRGSLFRPFVDALCSVAMHKQPWPNIYSFFPSHSSLDRIFVGHRTCGEKTDSNKQGQLKCRAMRNQSCRETVGATHDFKCTIKQAHISRSILTNSGDLTIKFPQHHHTSPQQPTTNRPIQTRTNSAKSTPLGKNVQFWHDGHTRTTRKSKHHTFVVDQHRFVSNTIHFARRMVQKKYPTKIHIERIYEYCRCVKKINFCPRKIQRHTCWVHASESFWVQAII